MSDSIQFPRSPEERERLRQQQIDDEETKQLPTLPSGAPGVEELEGMPDVPVGPHNRLGHVPPPLDAERRRALDIVLGSESFVVIGFREDGTGGGADAFTEAGGDEEQLQRVIDGLHDVLDRLLARKGLI